MSDTEPVAEAAAVPPAERLLNLVIALVNTSASMTKRQIRRAVAGYGDAPSAEAFERMFERDKDTLRALGVPIVTVDAGGHSDDVGYRIDNEAYALPPVELTPAELGVLALAAQLWGDKALRTDVSRAMTKLRAAGNTEAEDALAGLAPRVRAVGDAYGPLLDAVTQRRVVRFRYRAANSGAVTERRVEPWRIAARGGGWYVVGRDLDRGAARVFRLSRIEGRVRLGAQPGAFEPPAHVDVDAALGVVGAPRTALLAVAPERASAVRARALPTPSDAGTVGAADRCAVVPERASAVPATPTPTPAVGAAVGAADRCAVVPERASAVRAGALPTPADGADADASAGDDRGAVGFGSAPWAPQGYDVVAVPYTSTTTLAEELAGYADAVVVLAPEKLRGEVVRRLEAAAGLEGVGRG